jgi:hypothetical protein
MKKLAMFAASIGVAGSFAVSTAAPAQAACGQMDMYRDPSTYAWLWWASGSSFTRIEPHDNAAAPMRAAIDRYSSGTVLRYFGPYRTNSNFSHDTSYISATNGTNAGNGYASSPNSPNGLNTFYNDYPQYGCRFTS